MKKEFSDVLGHEYVNRNSGEKCLADYMDCDKIYYRRYDDLSKTYCVSYRGFRCGWKNNGPHKPFVGRVYKGRALNHSHWFNELIWVTSLSERIGGNCIIEFTILSKQREFSMDNKMFAQYFQLVS